MQDPVSFIKGTHHMYMRTSSKPCFQVQKTFFHLANTIWKCSYRPYASVRCPFLKMSVVDETWTTVSRNNWFLRPCTHHNKFGSASAQSNVSSTKNYMIQTKTELNHSSTAKKQTRKALQIAIGEIWAGCRQEVVGVEDWSKGNSSSSSSSSSRRRRPTATTTTATTITAPCTISTTFTATAGCWARTPSCEERPLRDFFLNTKFNDANLDLEEFCSKADVLKTKVFRSVVPLGLLCHLRHNL